MLLDNLHIRVFVARWAKIYPPHWRLQNVQNTYWRFYLNKTDGASIQVTNLPEAPDAPVSYPLEGGKSYFIPAGVRFNTDVNREVAHFFVHFDVLGMPAIAMRNLFNGPICLPISAALHQAIMDLPVVDFNAQTDQKVDLILECRVKALIYEGLTLYLQSLSPAQLDQSLQKAIALKPVLPAVNYIDANLSKSLLNPHLARLCQMNEDYFIYRFKECMGQTPGEYIREQRVKLAAQRLLFTADSIEQIAADSGFGSRFYLSRVFTKVAGLSPAAYRKASRV